VDIDHRGADFRGPSCVVPAESLRASFGEGIATCLCRLASGNGQRSRRNADRLTAILEGAMRHAGTLDPYAERWAQAPKAPGREAADLAACPDDGLEGSFATPRIAVTLLAPTGFPPLADLEARIQRLCAAQGAVAYFPTAGVNRPRDAAHQYARGLPSV